MANGRTVYQIAGVRAGSVEGVNVMDRATHLAALRLSTIPRSAILAAYSRQRMKTATPDALTLVGRVGLEPTTKGL